MIYHSKFFLDFLPSLSLHIFSEQSSCRLKVSGCAFLRESGGGAEGCRIFAHCKNVAGHVTGHWWCGDQEQRDIGGTESRHSANFSLGLISVLSLCAPCVIVTGTYL